MSVEMWKAVNSRLLGNKDDDCFGGEGMIDLCVSCKWQNEISRIACGIILHYSVMLCHKHFLTIIEDIFMLLT